MDSGTVCYRAFFMIHTNTMVGVQYFNVFIAVIIGIPVDKLHVFSLYRIVFYAIAGGERYLHAVIRDKKVSAAPHNFVGSIVKQIVEIKLQFQLRFQIVYKIAFHQVDRGRKINSVVAQIDQAYPLFKGERRVLSVIRNFMRTVREQAGSQDISFVSRFFRRKTAEADVFSPKGYGGAAGYRTVF